MPAARTAASMGHMDFGEPGGAPLNRAGRQRSAWAVLGIVLAVVLVIGGLALVAAIVVFAIGMSNYGSNK
jgi:hypothetical protein